MVKQNFPILLVDDNKHDVRIVQRAWRKNQINNRLIIVPHGQACLDYLRHEGKYSNPKEYPRPGIILMDIRMPIMDGIECLQAIKSDSKLKLIPVIMLTTSKEDADRIRSYQFGCNTFVQKPVDFDRLSEAMRRIHLYWTMCELP